MKYIYGKRPPHLTSKTSIDKARSGNGVTNVKKQKQDRNNINTTTSGAQVATLQQAFPPIPFACCHPPPTIKPCSNQQHGDTDDVLKYNAIPYHPSFTATARHQSLWGRTVGYLPVARGGHPSQPGRRSVSRHIPSSGYYRCSLGKKPHWVDFIVDNERELPRVGVCVLPHKLAVPIEARERGHSVRYVAWARAPTNV